MHMKVVACGGPKESDSLEQELQMVVIHQHGSWEINLDPMQMNYILLSFELPLNPIASCMFVLL